MSAVRPSVICERVRAQVSHQLDDELSQLERRMLAAHLERCSDCRSYADEVFAFTRTLREAPLESLERPLVLRRPRRASIGRLQVGVAAGLAVAILGAASQFAASETQSPSLARFEGARNLSPPGAVLEREQAILDVVRPGVTLPPPGSVL
ncbi:MAG TPA: zf-HC2 domain-containing protein [Gaiellaceae bacterium]